MRPAPESIYLQVGPDCTPECITDDVWRSGEVTWAAEQVFNTDIEYVRADLQAARIAELEAVVERLTRIAQETVNDWDCDEIGQLDGERIDELRLAIIDAEAARKAGQ